MSMETADVYMYKDVYMNFMTHCSLFQSFAFISFLESSWPVGPADHGLHDVGQHPLLPHKQFFILTYIDSLRSGFRVVSYDAMACHRWADVDIGSLPAFFEHHVHTMQT